MPRYSGRFNRVKSQGWDTSFDMDVLCVYFFWSYFDFHRLFHRWTSLKGKFPESIFELAAQKLCGAEWFKPYDRNQAFAVLAQRFCLDIAFGHRDAVSFVEASIASRLRVCIKTTEDRIWSYSTYPSEPLLSCAAASLLLGDASPMQHNLDLTLDTLKNMVNDGVVDIGQIGELVGRFIWLLAKDIFVRSSMPKVSKFDEKLQDCQLVSVVDYLEFVFGPRFWTDNGAAQEEFQDAYINFSHWISMDYNIRRDEEGLEQLPYVTCSIFFFFNTNLKYSIEKWTLCHWERTSAVQCCHDQPLIDKVIPMYFRNRSDGASGVSQILISDKARINSQKSGLKDIRRDHPSIAPGYRGLPYIAILTDLGADNKTSELEVALDSSSDRDTCLRIHAPGLDAARYSFLTKRDKMTEILVDLYKRQSAPSSSSHLQNLQDQVQFGASSEPCHMNLK